MRKFKFRVWDNVAKKMYYSEMEQYDDEIGFRFKHFMTDTPIYMQYTGIKDINGKEIYEGDIVEYTLTNVKRTSVVEFKNGEFFPHPEEYWPDDEYYGYEYKDFEVIGNIYELLEY